VIFLGGWVGVIDDPVFRDSGSSQSLRPSHPPKKSHPRSKCSTFRTPFDDTSPPRKQGFSRVAATCAFTLACAAGWLCGRFDREVGKL